MPFEHGVARRRTDDWETMPRRPASDPGIAAGLHGNRAVVVRQRSERSRIRRPLIKLQTMQPNWRASNLMRTRNVTHWFVRILKRNGT